MTLLVIASLKVSHMPTRNQVRAEILRQYSNLEACCADLSVEAASLLQSAYNAAFANETQHRRSALNRGFRHKQAVDVAARYFVLQGFREPRTLVSMIDVPGGMLCLKAARLRPDLLYSSALRELCDLHKASVDLGQAFPIQYLEHVA